MALRAGETEIVKASLTGSIIGNILMVLGLAMLLGGWKHKELKFSRMAAESGSSMMVLAVVALVIPAIYAQVTHHTQPGHIESLSFDISLGADPDLRGQPALLAEEPQAPVRGRAAKAHDEEHDGAASGPCGTSIAVLVVAAGFVGWVSEFLVHAVDAAGDAMGLGKVFMGVVVVAIVGNAAEHSTAVLVAMKGKMDLALGIAMGSSMQIALFVAPVLVIAGHFMGTPLGLEFTILEVVAVMLSVAAVSLLVHRRQDELVRGRAAPGHLPILAIAFYYV